jgi:hypothetical protein
MNDRRLRLWGGVLLLAAAVVFLPVGCSKQKTQIVSGNVTYKGNPVVFGQVVFYTPDSKVVAGIASIGPDGAFSFNASRLPEGDLAVAILTTDAISADRIGVPAGMPTPPVPMMREGDEPGRPPVGPRKPPPPPKQQPDDQGSASSKVAPGRLPPKPSAETTFPANLPPAAAAQKGTLQAIQKQYGNPESSGLTFNKAANPEKFDINLEGK